MLFRDLEDRERSGNPVRVGLVGAGQMGEGLVAQMEKMNGMNAYAVADVVPNRAYQVLKSAGNPEELIVETTDVDLASQAVADGKRVATTDAGVVARIAGLDVVVEATGIPEVGARVAMDVILERKHMVQMNVETDATVGYILRRMANAAGVIYTLTAGDEPGSTMELYDFATSLGFEVVVAGKGKNNPLNRASNPDTAAEKAARQQMNPKMLASFEDGTKTMVEMTSLGNAIGFVPDVRGMHGPTATPKTIAEVYRPKSMGGVLDNLNVVEYGVGISPGVFVVFTTDHPKIVRDLQYLSMGDGPYWALYRPYHLTSLETPISIARAALKGDTTIATDMPPVCETITVAKRDLKAGEKIDALGGFTVYGIIEAAAIAREQNLLPLGLAPGSTLLNDVKTGDPVTYDDVQINEAQTIVDLRRLQDRMVGGQ
jgi:predicted homoserine dehydrogenase-like protein